MKNPLGTFRPNTGSPLEKKTGGKLSQVFGKRGTSKKFITGK